MDVHGGLTDPGQAALAVHVIVGDISSVGIHIAYIDNGENV
jgi:hypothetical protein